MAAPTTPPTTPPAIAPVLLEGEFSLFALPVELGDIVEGEGAIDVPVDEVADVAVWYIKSSVKGYVLRLRELKEPQQKDKTYKSRETRRKRESRSRHSGPQPRGLLRS